MPAFIAGSVLQIYNAARAAGSGALDQTVIAREMERRAMIGGETPLTLGPQPGAIPVPADLDTLRCILAVFP